MFDALDPLKCPQNHRHQVIEGAAKVQGQTVLRSKFSEEYPRKFARLIARVILKNQFPKEKPLGSLIDPVLAVADCLYPEILASTAKERPAKGLRRAPIKGAKHDAATGALEQPPRAKRLKSSDPNASNPETVENSQPMNMQLVTDVCKRIGAILPRVGKKQIDSPNILHDLHQIFPDMKIHKVMACKGTDRRWGPPDSVQPTEAPFRRSIMKLREGLEVTIDPKWENYSMLSNRQLIRKSPACRVNITMFAAMRPVDNTGPFPTSANEMSMRQAPEGSSTSSAEMPVSQQSQENVFEPKSVEMINRMFR
eukprot:s1620_g3.t1